MTVRPLADTSPAPKNPAVLKVSAPCTLPIPEDKSRAGSGPACGSWRGSQPADSIPPVSGAVAGAGTSKTARTPLERLVVQYPDLSSKIARSPLKSLLERYPDLALFPPDAFMFAPTSVSSHLTGPGALSLFAGSRRWERSMLSRGCPWVLCIDTLHHPDLDLTYPALREKLEILIGGGTFLAVGGGPPCSSLSVAVTPPIRCKEFPAGRPGLPPPVRERIRVGNLLANWMAFAYRRCVALDVAVWVENPDSSWLWRLRSWKRIIANKANIFGEWRVDYCRFGTRWRKRTRFATNTALQGEVRFCTGLHEHWRLRGTYGGSSRTKLAEPYPYPLCCTLASACCQKAGWVNRTDSPCRA